MCSEQLRRMVRWTIRVECRLQKIVRTMELMHVWHVKFDIMHAMFIYCCQSLYILHANLKGETRFQGWLFQELRAGFTCIALYHPKA